jgi:hypothetical protein
LRRILFIYVCNLAQLKKIIKQTFQEEVLADNIYKEITLKSLDADHYDLKGATRSQAAWPRCVAMSASELC